MNAAWARMQSAVIGGGMIPPGSGVLVAVSGGRDSMVLLEALGRWRMQQAWRLVVAHFHHQLRGAEADGDQALVAVTAAKSGLAFVSGSADVATLRAAGESWESAARRLRHAFLARTAREHGCFRIALGHHGGDQVELFLLRLLRGAGAAGLGGMGEVDPSPADPGVRLVRPMLGCAAEEVEALAREWAVDFRTDATNGDTTYLRNRVRHELMPLLASRYQPAVERVLQREQTLLRDQAEFLEVLAKEWLGPVPANGRKGYDDLPVALQREVLRVQAAKLSLSLDFDRIEALRQRAGEPIQLSRERRVVRETSGRIRVVDGDPGGGPFLDDWREVSLEAPHGLEFFGGVRLAWQISADRLGSSTGPKAMFAVHDPGRIPPGETPGSTAGGTPAATDGRFMGEPPRVVRGREAQCEVECLDADALGGRIRLRHWRPGDRFQPIGLGAAAKLQDLFTNARVPVADRRRRVVAETEEGTLFWVEGLRIGDNAKVRGSTVRTLVWRWERSAA